MSRYQGGKSRLGAAISERMREIEQEVLGNDPNAPPLAYAEPFVGMCGVMRHMAEPRDRDCYASDANTDVIAMWQGLQKGWRPPTNVTEKEYDRLKASKGPSAARGFVGSACSFAGNFFSGFSELYDRKNTNYSAVGARSVMKVFPKVEDVHFKPSDYRDLNPEGMLVYCDPPYVNSKQAKPNPLFREFDNEEFWDTMREWSKSNLVFVSEEKAPPDFVPVWEKDYKRWTNQKKWTKKFTSQGKKAPVNNTKEKLFMYKELPDPRHFGEEYTPP